MTPINSNEDLYQALQEATKDRITKVGEKDNPMTLKLRQDYCVTIYADNHEILLGIFRGRERIQKHYHSYDQVYHAVLGMESRPDSKRKVMKITGTNRTQRREQQKTTVKRGITFTLGIVLTLFGGFFFLLCLSGAVEDGFQPLHVHVSLLFSFGVILLAGIAVIYIGLKKNTKLEAVVGNPYPVRVPDNKTVKSLLRELKNRTEKDAIRLQIDESRIPTLTGSKLGGIPYWDSRQAYPADSNGNPLVLLAQFNLRELPENDLLPKTGLLQFFLLDDRYYGVPLQESGYPQNTYQVVYHEKIDESVTKEQVLALGIRTSLDFLYPTERKTGLQGDRFQFPVIGEYAVCFQTVKVYMNDNDVRCNDMLHKIAGEMGIELDSRLEFNQLFDAFENGDQRYANIHESTWGHYLFGYPHFTQEDPRSPEGAEYYDILLFQLDSDSWNEKWRVLWGDAGVGSFFINSKRLAAMDFDDVLYHWDCC